jgi:crotonobetainyl-CoA:carnitine CoA-transferase CaiB-like acyl-CoA transferase
MVMDEVVQMMGGLAYMTGPPGQPLRAGTSVIDIGGGMFAVIAILAALEERTRTGKGTVVRSALFETTAFFMGQHMAYAAITKEPVPPMPARVSAWSVYRVFQASDGPVFVGIISDKQWAKFAESFGKPEWAHDPRLLTNNQRIGEARWLLSAIEEILSILPRSEIIARCERGGIPVSPIARPEDLFDDPQSNRPGGGLLETRLPSGDQARLPRLPVEIGDHAFDKRLDPPAVGAHTRALLREAGFGDGDIDALVAAGVVTAP